MATVDYDLSGSVSGKIVATWTPLTASDVGEVLIPQGPRSLAGALQLTGTFGVGTVTLQKSNDGTNWVTVKDLDGANIAATAAGMYEFSTAALQLRISADASVTSVTAIMVLRG